MPIYETLTILHPELAEARVKEVVAWMQQILEGSQGNMLQVDEWGMRNLAYKIQKQGRGYYVRLEYEAAPAALQELERNCRLSEDVIRFLSIVRDAPSEKRPAARPQAPAAEALTVAPAESAVEPAPETPAPSTLEMEASAEAPTEIPAEAPAQAASATEAEPAATSVADEQ